MIYSEKLIEEIAKKYNLKLNKAKAIVIFIGSWEDIDRRMRDAGIVEENEGIVGEYEGMAELNNLTINDMLEIEKMVISNAN